MIRQAFTAAIVGIIGNTAVTEINVRSGPGTNNAIVLKSPVGQSGLVVTDVQPDAEGKTFSGKTYQWMKLSFPGGQAGWARDDLLEVVGDGTAFGYGMIATPTHAFALNRVTVAVAAGPVPVTPAPSAPAPAPAPAIPAPAVPLAPASGVCTAFVIMRDGANARSGPSTSHAQVMRVPRDARFQVMQVKPEDGTGAYKWVNGTYQGQNIWMREDLLYYEGDIEAFGLGKADVYPASMKNRWWVRGFTGLDGHWGWDWGALTGEPVWTPPVETLVIHSVECQKCAGGKSFKSYGLPLSHPGALNDPNWNFGYGHYVIVRCLHDTLPNSTKAWLAQNGRAGMHLFVMYAHLHSRSVHAGQTLPPSAQVGTCGDTGNSEAAHLHLEVRGSKNPTETNWAAMKAHLLDPTILFGR